MTNLRTDANPADIRRNTDRFIEFLEVAADLNRTQMGQRAVVQFKPTAVFPNELMVLFILTILRFFGLTHNSTYPIFFR